MMKRILTLAVALAIPLAALAADTKISAFPSMSALGATDIFLGNQGGVTKTATAAQLGTYVLTVANTVFSFNAGTSFSGASWATTSPVFNGAAMTLNDTTASGTVALEAAYSLQAPNFTSTGGASTTITRAVTLYLAAPTCSGGVVCTGLESLNAPGKVTIAGGAQINGTVNINVGNNAATNINTSTTNTALTLGGTTAGNIVNLASVSTRFGHVLYESATAPTINSHFNTSGDSIVAASTAAFQITVGSGTGTTTGSLTMPAATTGWACEATDVTTPASHAIQQTASSTTGVTVTDYIRTTGIAQNFANGDKINFVCGAF